MVLSRDIPAGILMLRCIARKICRKNNCKIDFWYRSSVLIITFLSYMAYHMTRKPISVVKNVFHRNCSDVPRPNVVSPALDVGNDSDWCEWAPFEGEHAEALLGMLDSAFLFAYAGAMFISGMVAERVNLRYFLSFGMMFSGILSYMFGLAKSLNLHYLSYFIAIQILMGIFQTTGWPAVVAVVGYWFGRGKRGLIFGVWNSHTSIGNILGSLIAAYYVETNWGNSFIVPGLIMSIVGFIVFFFLVIHPEDVGCTPPQAGINVASYSPVPVRHEDDTSGEEAETSHDNDNGRLLPGTTSPYRRNRHSVTERSPILRPTEERAIGFFGALKIPGVIEFSLSLFFSKLVSYTFLYWLPRYIKYSTTLNPTLSADLSTLFDVGGIVGAILAGVVTDFTNMPATVCVGMLLQAVPSLLLYRWYGSVGKAVNIILLLVCGAFVNGPYALITTAVSAELGTHESLQGNAKALSTVTAIIDGTGSIGAAVGPLLAGLISPTGWNNVFYLLMASDVLALLLLLRLTWKEVKVVLARHRIGQFSV
ncbi:UNVERIFIED_CONTAM: hypothetical protein PYX00_002165 [Menopon gallinae]|uniref:Sugar phosphate exchanger 3 n=1 Tax=Menopon gallinae TaxID=328185 RepID=A0AAW2IHV4_9NEOP